ncbi:unnamed protein product [Symbiodinium microadriaticum]|nr:unnamed protein product [Symbiodinium microadriaticum]
MALTGAAAKGTLNEGVGMGCAPSAGCTKVSEPLKPREGSLLKVVGKRTRQLAMQEAEAHPTGGCLIPLSEIDSFDSGEAAKSTAQTDLSRLQEENAFLAAQLLQANTEMQALRERLHEQDQAAARKIQKAWRNFCDEQAICAIFGRGWQSMMPWRALEIDYCKHYREGGCGLQYLLEAMGGFRDIRKGFAFIREAGPAENSDGQFTSWTEEQVNHPNGPLFKWDKGTIKEFLHCLADKGSQANTIRDWPLTLKSFTPWALNTIFAPILPRILEHAVILIGKSEVGKSPTAYTLTNLASAFWLLQKGRENETPSFQSCSHLDYFRKERGRPTKPRVFDNGNFNLESPASVKAVTEVTGFDKKTMARWNASSYEKNQLFVVCSNPTKPALPPQTNSDTVSFEAFYKLVRPSFHKDFDEEDLMGVFKRSVRIVFTDMGIYVRSPGTHRDPIKRVAWRDKDFGVVSLAARPTLSAYLKGHLQQLPPNHAEDMQWSLNLLQAALDGEEVPLCYTVTGNEFSTGKKYLDFWQYHSLLRGHP